MGLNERVLSDRAAAFLVEELGYGPESPDYADKLERVTQMLVDVATRATREAEMGGWNDALKLAIRVVYRNDGMSAEHIGHALSLLIKPETP